MAPFFNVESGAMRDEDLYTDTPDPSMSKPDEPTPTPTPATAAPARAPAWTIPPPTTALDAKREHDRLRAEWLADPSHLLGDDRHREHAAALAYYSALGELADGRDPVEGAEVLGEVFANGQIRALGADALSPAPRPNLPEGFEFDEAALVLAETEAYAMGVRPSFIMEVTDALAEIAEQAEARGVGWTERDAQAELERRHGRAGAVRVASNARLAYETLLESEHPLLVQRVRELGEEWGDDPRVITLFGTLVYNALSEGPLTPAKEALILRRAEKQAKAEAAGRARVAEARQDEDAEGDAARAASMTATAIAHRRWGKSEP
jgi:hypothetical protein